MLPFGSDAGSRMDCQISFGDTVRVNTLIRAIRRSVCTQVSYPAMEMRVKPRELRGFKILNPCDDLPMLI
jgi:hypothetical protein